MHPFDEPPVVPPGDEAWKRLGHPEVFHVPKKPGGGSRATIGDDDGSWESKVYIHNTHQSFIKIWPKLQCDLFITTGLVP